jgi:hypothetical protein
MTYVQQETTVLIIPEGNSNCNLKIYSFTLKFQLLLSSQ